MNKQQIQEATELFNIWWETNGDLNDDNKEVELRAFLAGYSMLLPNNE